MLKKVKNKFHLIFKILFVLVFVIVKFSLASESSCKLDSLKVAKYKESGNNVKNLQQCLRKIGYSLKASGFYGEETKNVIRQFYKYQVDIDDYKGLVFDEKGVKKLKELANLDSIDDKKFVEEVKEFQVYSSNQKITSSESCNFIDYFYSEKEAESLFMPSYLKIQEFFHLSFFDEGFSKSLLLNLPNEDHIKISKDGKNVFLCHKENEDLELEYRLISNKKFYGPYKFLGIEDKVENGGSGYKYPFYISEDGLISSFIFRQKDKTYLAINDELYSIDGQVRDYSDLKNKINLIDKYKKFIKDEAWVFIEEKSENKNKEYVILKEKTYGPYDEVKNFCLLKNESTYAWSYLKDGKLYLSLSSGRIYENEAEILGILSNCDSSLKIKSYKSPWLDNISGIYLFYDIKSVDGKSIGLDNSEIHNQGLYFTNDNWEDNKLKILYYQNKLNKRYTHSSIWDRYNLEENFFSLDKSNSARILKEDNKYWVELKDGKKFGPYQDVIEVKFSNKGLNYGWSFKKDGKFYIQINDKVFGPYDTLERDLKLYDGKVKFYFFARVEDKSYLYVNDEKIDLSQFYNVSNLYVSKNASSYGLIFSKREKMNESEFYYVKINDSLYGPYEGIINYMVFSRDGLKYAWEVRTDKYIDIYLNGSLYKRFKRVLDSDSRSLLDFDRSAIYFSKEGLKYYRLFSDANKRLFYFQIDDELLGPYQFEDKFLIRHKGDSKNNPFNLPIIFASITEDGLSYIFSFVGFRKLPTYSIQINSQKYGPYQEDSGLAMEMFDIEPDVGYLARNPAYVIFQKEGIFKNFWRYKKDSKYYIQINNKSFGPYDYVWGPYLSKDGSVYGYKFEIDKKYYYRIKDKIYGPYDKDEMLFNYDEDRIYISSDGSKFAFRYLKDDKKYVVFNGKRYGPYDSVSEIYFSKNGLSYGWRYIKDNKAYFLINNKIYGPYDKALKLSSKRSYSYGYRYGSFKDIPVYIEFSPYGSFFTFAYINKGEPYLQVNDKVYKGYLNLDIEQINNIKDGDRYEGLFVSQPVYFSEDDSSYALLTSKKEGDNKIYYLELNGKSLILDKEVISEVNLYLLPKKKGYFAIYRKASKDSRKDKNYDSDFISYTYVNLNGKIYGPYENDPDNYNYLYSKISPDGEKVAWVYLKKDKFYFQINDKTYGPYEVSKIETPWSSVSGFNILFSDDLSNYFVIYKDKKERYYFQANDKFYGPYQEQPVIIFSPDKKRFMIFSSIFLKRKSDRSDPIKEAKFYIETEKGKKFKLESKELDKIRFLINLENKVYYLKLIEEKVKKGSGSKAKIYLKRLNI